MGKVFVGGGVDSIRLLVDDGTSKNDLKSSFISAANQSLPLKMRYLRRIYFFLAVQFIIISIVAFVLHMIPPVRPFVQHHFYLLPLMFLGLLMTLGYLRWAAPSTFPRLLAFLVFTVLMCLFVPGVSAYFDSELGYQISFLMATVTLAHSCFCLQSLRDLNVMCSSVASLAISAVSSVFLQVALSIFTYDYVTTILVSTCICTYIHANIRFFMARFSFQQWHLACISVYTAPLPPYKY